MERELYKIAPLKKFTEKFSPKPRPVVPGDTIEERTRNRLAQHNLRRRNYITTLLRGGGKISMADAALAAGYPSTTHPKAKWGGKTIRGIMNDIAEEIGITTKAVLQGIWDEARADAKGPAGQPLDTNASARIRAWEDLAKHKKIDGFVADDISHSGKITIEYVTGDEWRGKEEEEEV